MQCITYDIERVGNATFTAVRIGKGATLSAILAQCVCFGAEATEMPKLTATLAERVSFTAERICSFFPGSALGVTPEVVWLNESNDYTAYFEVASNVEWKIE